MAGADAGPRVEELRCAGGEDVPNNPLLPVLLYRGAIMPGPDAADRCAALFAANGWPGAWRNGIFAHHHYHSTAHEVLGIAAGSATVRLGGAGGQSVALRAGDVVVIPAGVAHKREVASGDLLVVGAYPRGQSPDLCRAGAAARERALVTLAGVPLPESDPLGGRSGPLVERWRAAARG